MSQQESEGDHRIEYHSDGTATLYLSEVLWIRVTPEQCESWIHLLRGVAQTILVLQHARRAQVAMASGTWPAADFSGRPLGWAKKLVVR